MSDYSVINNVNVFVRLSGFIHPTSPRVLLESSKRTTSTLDHFLVFSGRQPPLRSDHATVRAYDHVYRLPCGWRQQTEIDVSRSRCLTTTMCSLIHCMPLVGQIRRSACDIWDRERRPETRPMLKPRSVTKRTPPSFFDTTYIFLNLTILLAFAR